MADTVLEIRGYFKLAVGEWHLLAAMPDDANNIAHPGAGINRGAFGDSNHQRFFKRTRTKRSFSAARVSSPGNSGHRLASCADCNSPRSRWYSFS